MMYRSLGPSYVPSVKGGGSGDGGSGGGQVHFGLHSMGPKQQPAKAPNVERGDASLSVLNAVRHKAPDRVLDVLQGLYKFHFYRGELERARDVVFQLLIKASLQGGFNRDWTRLRTDSADWNETGGPARSFLLALKALALINLRQGDQVEAASILDTLRRLDPEDQVDADPVRSLMEGVDNDTER